MDESEALSYLNPEEFSKNILSSESQIEVNREIQCFQREIERVISELCDEIDKLERDVDVERKDNIRLKNEITALYNGFEYLFENGKEKYLQWQLEKQIEKL